MPLIDRCDSSLRCERSESPTRRSPRGNGRATVHPSSSSMPPACTVDAGIASWRRFRTGACWLWTFGVMVGAVVPPPPYRWSHLARDVIEVVERLALERVVGVGHSMGGHLVTRAAAALPSRFDRLLLLDPAIVPPEILRMIALAGDRIPPVRRRSRFAAASEMVARLQTRKASRAGTPESSTTTAPMVCAPLRTVRGSSSPAHRKSNPRCTSDRPIRTSTDCCVRSIFRCTSCVRERIRKDTSSRTFPTHRRGPTSRTSSATPPRSV
jgi:pimeloyl-ACP methyl ester carboxylesterase